MVILQVIDILNTKSKTNRRVVKTEIIEFVVPDCLTSIVVFLCFFYVRFINSGITMPILFSVVARGTVVLAKYASCAGNFTEVTEQILSKIPPHDDRLTYSHGNYLFHYIAENKLVYFCITDDVSNVFLLILVVIDLVKV